MIILPKFLASLIDLKMRKTDLRDNDKNVKK